MQKLTLHLFILLIILSSCKKNDDCSSSEICPDCVEPITYIDYNVDFYSTHKDYEVLPATFETVTELIQLKPAHQEGATFETVQETILVKASYSRFEILESTNLHFVVNSEIDSIKEINCFRFFDPADFKEIEVPAEYITVTKENLLSQGIGVEVPAEYAAIEKKILNTPFQIIDNTEEQVFERVRFRIPDNQNIRDYLMNQFSHHGVSDFVENNSYKIWE